MALQTTWKYFSLNNYKFNDYPSASHICIKTKKARWCLFPVHYLINMTIIALLHGLSRNLRLEVTRFSVPTTSETFSVIWRDAKCNTSRLTAPGSLNTCLMCEEQRWIFNEPTISLWYTGPPPCLGLDPKDPEILGLKACWKLFVNLTAGTQSVNRMINNPNLF